ncbi:MAG: hypothetical protein R3195_08370 [Gemmatimonadota bacterium]|nr:hypothetical protein [Gemmatimonadota bacterium]
MTGSILTTTTVAAGLSAPALWLLLSLAGGPRIATPPANAPATTTPPAPAAPGFDRAWILNGPTSGDVGDDIVIDDEGTMFIAGSHGGLDIDRDGAIELPADEIDPLFIKIGRTSQDGWARGLESPGFTTATGVAPDRQGGV